MAETQHASGPSERTARATAWFARLADALERGRLADAGVAQRELGQLGFLVTLRIPQVRRPRKGVSQ